MGSGVLVPTLTRRYPEYTRTDAPNCQAAFRAADLLQDDDLPTAHFDAIVCFSVLEHLVDVDGATRALARALAPGPNPSSPSVTAESTTNT